jgi:hypothetical protein
MVVVEEVCLFRMTALKMDDLRGLLLLIPFLPSLPPLLPFLPQQAAPGPICV